MRQESEVIIVGAGLAGLACGVRLEAAGLSATIVEASDGVGGRIRTDRLDGFRLDRGFQVMLTSYQEASRVLDFRKLDLRSFLPGALVRVEGEFHRVSDPLRRPGDLAATLKAPVGSLSDKTRMGRLRARLALSSVEDIFARPAVTTLAALRREGFSDRMIDRFLRPFLAGIFLERDLETSSRMFEFVFRAFATGDAALPADGMEAIPRQLGEQLTQSSLRLRARVESIEDGAIVLDDGERIAADAIVVATDGPSAARLLPGIAAPRSRSVMCLYYAANEPPLREPILVLNGADEGPINNLTVPSSVAPAYAPRGNALISATVLGDVESKAELERAVRTQLRAWFGHDVDSWRHLRTYRISHALPAGRCGEIGERPKDVRVSPRLYVCGDYREHASIEGSLISGRRAADALLADLGVP